MNNKSIKIVYLTHARIPTEKAHGLATVKLCEAFASEGVEVLLLHAQSPKKENIFDFYNIKNNFSEKTLPSLDLVRFGKFKKIFFIVHVFTFSVIAFFYVILNGKKYKDAVFFSHNHAPLYFLTFLGHKIFYDIHDFPSPLPSVLRVIDKSFGFSTQTKWKVDAFCKKFGVPREKITYWPNGVDLKDFNIVLNKFEAREKLGLPQSGKIVLYTGQLFDWKGVDTLISAAGLLNAGAHIYIIGGAEEDMRRLKKELPRADYSRIKFISFQEHRLMPLWLKAADVLVLPNTAKKEISLYYTSPMKLFEYMASGRPIVASRIPSITEILNDKNSILAEADNPASFAEKINYVLDNSSEADFKAEAAGKDVLGYTWHDRVLKILSLLNKLNAS